MDEVIRRFSNIIVWDEYLEKFKRRQDDTINGKPKLQYLREFAEAVIGKVVKVRIPTLVSTDLFAYAVCEVEFIQHNGIPVIFTGVATASVENTPEKFSIFPAETAASRAESRAYRRALNLRTLSDEETLADKDETPITGGGLLPSIIKAFCNENGINLEEFSLSKMKKPFSALNTEEQQKLYNELKKKERE